MSVISRPRTVDVGRFLDMGQILSAPALIVGQGPFPGQGRVDEWLTPSVTLRCSKCSKASHPHRAVSPEISMCFWKVFYPGIRPLILIIEIVGIKTVSQLVVPAFFCARKRGIPGVECSFRWIFNLVVLYSGWKVRELLSVTMNMVEIVNLYFKSKIY